MVTLLLVGVVAGSTVSLAVAGAPFATPILLVSAQEDESTPLSATVETYDGQVAAEDGDVTVTGSASTDGDVVVVFVGSRGTVVASTLPVTDDRFFTSIDLDEMENGFVDGIVVSPSTSTPSRVAT